MKEEVLASLWEMTFLRKWKNKDLQSSAGLVLYLHYELEPVQLIPGSQLLTFQEFCKLVVKHCHY